MSALRGIALGAVAAILVVGCSCGPTRSDWERGLAECDIEAVREEIAAGADLTDTGEYQTTGTPSRPLVEAVRCGPDVVEVLLAAGADPNLGDWLRSPAAEAASLGDVSSLRLLLDAGADPMWMGSRGDSLLHEAVQAGSTFDWGAASGRGETADVLALLIERGAPLDHVDDAGLNALDSAIFYGDADAVAVLIDAGLTIDEQRTENPTDLFYAIGHHDVRIVDAVLSQGADPNRIANVHTTEIGLFIYNLNRSEQTEVVRTLGPHLGLDPALIENFEAGTPLDGLRLLAEAGEDALTADHQVTPLYAAVAAGDTAVVEALLDAGADPHQGLPSDGHTPAAAAADLDRSEILGMFQDE